MNDGDHVMWVIYLAIREAPDSCFTRSLEKCKSIANAELASCLQMDGTRHVSLWAGKMTKQQASKICFDEIIELPTAIQFCDWIPKAAYLQLDSTSQANLKDIVSELENLPSAKTSTTICDHLSLYRCRGMNWQSFQKETAKIRKGVPAKEWGMVQGVTIRLKAIGTDYDHCRVLAGL